MSPEAVIFIGIQGVGKSTFYSTRYAGSHVRISLDMLRTRHRESILLSACIAAGQSFVVDNTNPARADRERYLSLARDHGFRVVGCYFQSRIQDCLLRNAERSGKQRVPDKAVLGTYSRLELPVREEGFDELWYVSALVSGGFSVLPWTDEV